MSDKYVLDAAGNPVAVSDLVSWSQWFETADRHVARSEKDGVRVSTVFLSIDHSFGYGPPMLYETMIFGGEHDEYQDRCSTREQAERMHQKACALAGIAP